MNHFSPLSIQFVWHPDDSQAVVPIVNYCKKNLSRNQDNPFLRSLDFPIFCFTSKTESVPSPINIMSEKTLVFVFFGTSIVISEEWKKYIFEDCENENVKKVYIALNKYAFNLKEIEQTNCIRYEEHTAKFEDEMLHRRMFVDISHEVYRWLLESDEHNQLNLFISHTKNDINGVNLAKEIKEFIDSDTRMKNFFDVNDIQAGDDFNDTICENIKKSTLVVVHSNTYSSRFWCQKEILCAKQNGRPIIEVNCIDGFEDRSFPFMCNYPTIRFNDNILEVIELALMETIRFYYCDRLMRMYRENGYLIGVKTFNSVPDSFMINDTEEEVIVYPEPELYPDEYKILTSKKIITTPLSFRKSDIHNKKIGISISGAPEEDMGRLGQDSNNLKCLSKILAQKIIRSESIVVYGGDLRPNGFTQFLFEEARIAKFNRTDDEKILVENFISWPAQQLENEEIKKWSAEHIGICKFIRCTAPQYVNSITKSALDEYIWGRCLTDMREKMIDECDIRICAGGKIINYKGCMPGILEEVLIAVEKRKPVYLLGGFGGITERICRYILTGKLPEELTQKWQINNCDEYSKLIKKYTDHSIFIDYSRIESVSMESLNNGLSEEENKRLFTTPFLEEIIYLISRGLRNLYPKAT